MLKRRKRIQKYIRALRNKKGVIAAHPILKYQLEPVQRVPQNVQSIGSLLAKEYPTQEEACWHDSDQELDLGDRNMYRKLALIDHSQKNYEGKLRRFYQARSGGNNWAKEGEGREQDISDLLEAEQVYDQVKKGSQPIVQYLGKSIDKHQSVVTGTEWKGQVLASVGLDQKVKLWSLKAEENPELRIKLEKEVYTEGFSLTGCGFIGQQLFLGTNRQNYLALNCNKWSLRRLASSFLNEHRSFQNIRVSPSTRTLALFSAHRASIVDSNNLYTGSLLAPEPIVDLQFGRPHQVFGASSQALYEWDLRTFRTVGVWRENLGYTRLTISGETVALGNRLGVVRLHTMQGGLKEYAEVSNLVTHITGLNAGSDGRWLLAHSKWKSDAVRLIDVNRGRCLPSWPTPQTRVGFPTSGAVADGAFAVGGSNGVISFYGLSA